MNSIRAIILAGVSQLVITTAFAAPDNAVIRANAAAGVAATKACIAPLDNPFHESHAYAMMHLAIHDALNAIDRKYQPYAYDTKADPGTSPDAAVAAAAHDVLVPTIQKLPAELLQGWMQWRMALQSPKLPTRWLWPSSLMVQRRPRGSLWERLRRRQPLRSERMITPMMAARTQQELSSGWPAWSLSMHTGAPHSSPSRHGQTSLRSCSRTIHNFALDRLTR